MKKLTSKQTRLFQAKMFSRNGTTWKFFTWQEPRWKGGMVSYEDWKSTWNSVMREAIRRGSAEEEVRKHRDCVTGAWKQISKQRRPWRVDVSYDPSMVSALQHGTWMDKEGFKKTCIREKKRGDIHQPFYDTWVHCFWQALWVHCTEMHTSGMPLTPC